MIPSALLLARDCFLLGQLWSKERVIVLASSACKVDLPADMAKDLSYTNSVRVILSSD